MTQENKKEKVLHTRISPDLEKQIRKEARSLGVSVSNLVRNVLSNTFDLVDNIVTDSAAITRSARRRSASSSAQKQGGAAADPAFETGRVLGWQEAILNLNAICRQCNRILEKGSRAAIAVVEGNGPRPTLCLTCLKEMMPHEDTGPADTNE
ncbi:MAG: hypothetical protein ACOZBW_09575 [Thermodesulfobacteriota bacterium]